MTVIIMYSKSSHHLSLTGADKSSELTMAVEKF